MKIDLINVAYTVSMVILAFVAAIVLTKTISRYVEKRKKNNEDDCA
ncbi:hypothetical protein ACM66Z_09310 [Sulfurovum sp. ST-21]|uniref:Uncharacterized protein n=1 Tax=Sulfurovum indicum TaxID=2779528 RepID=A0A7M1S349_9BACT|nr:hypothetical protein [Sulfurovum indicum]QOR61624.1 hypothetical protein IMZ28_09295 [Sulfurovum indicum]